MGDSRLVNRNVNSARGRTSVRLEPELWDALGEICRRERQTLAEAVRAVELQNAGAPGGRTSAIRVRIVSYFRAAATAAGHLSAGHGSED